MTTVTLHRAQKSDETVHLPSNQACQIEQGDKLVFPFAHDQVSRLQRVGMDLILYFADQSQWCLQAFFLAEKANLESALSFSDHTYTAVELDEAFTVLDKTILGFNDIDAYAKRFHPQILSSRTASKMSGAAVEDSLYVYHFVLDKDIPEHAKPIVKVNGGDMPNWLSLADLGNRHYMLSGTPSEKHVGELNIEIFVEV